MSEAEARLAKRDTSDATTAEASSASPFDDILRETYGRQSARPSDDNLGSSRASARESQGAQFLDMETGQIVGAAGRGAAVGDGATKPSTKETSPADEGEDFAVLAKSKFGAGGAARAEGDKPGPDPAKPGTPVAPEIAGKAGGEGNTGNGADKPNVESGDKPKSEGGTTNKPELPNYKPERDRNRRHETSLEKMTDWLNKNFEVLDGDKNGTVTREELGKQMETPALANGEGGVYLATAFGTADTWKGVASELSGKKSAAKELEPKPKSKDAKSDPNVGITRDDIKTVRENLKQFDSKEMKDRRALDSLNRDFDSLDTNGDKTITAEELDTALKDKGVDKEQREKLELLRKNFKEVSATTDDVIKLRYAGGHGGDAGSDVQKPTKDGKPLEGVESVSKLDLAEYTQRDSVLLQKALENHTKHLGNDAPVTQGQTGSCFVLAPVSAILDKDPTFFDDKIKDLGNGQLQVTMPENEGHLRTLDTVISKPTDAERARFGGGETAAIIEKAASQHLKKVYGNNKAEAVQEQLHNGGNEYAAIRMLTGNKSVRTSTGADDEKLRGELGLVSDSSKGVTAGTHADVPENSGLMPSHVYHVTGFDKATGEVELTNPHKGDFGGQIEPTKPGGAARDGKFDGKFKISLAEFKDHFAEINTFDIRKK